MKPNDVRTTEEALEPESGQKQPWVKPVIKASADFDAQALACAEPDSNPFACGMGVSGA